MAKALLALTSGYAGDARTVCNDALFDCASSELVLVKDIPVFSMCEHHMLPFYGKVHVAYLPQGKVLGGSIGSTGNCCTSPRFPASACACAAGLSKFARLVELFSKRLQIQERLTAQIGEAVQDVVGAAGVAVLVDCTCVYDGSCMCM
jgi:GTP cyclohydrolase IA